MTATFYTVNLKTMYGGWVLYRDGEFFAAPFPSKKEAIAYAKTFCEANGYQFSLTK